MLTVTSFGEFDTIFLYVNGRLMRDNDAGTGFIGMALTLHGQVALGGTLVNGGGLLGDDNFNGSILGFVAHNRLLSANEIRQYANAFFAADPNVVLEPGSTVLVAVGLAGLPLTQRRMRG